MKNFIFVIIRIFCFIWIYFLKNNSEKFNYDFLKWELFLNSISILNWIFIFIISFYILNVIINKFKKILDKKNFNFKHKELFFELLLKFLNISKFILSFYVALKLLILPEDIILIINKIFKVSFIIAFIILLTTFTKTILKELEKKENKLKIWKHIFPIINTFLTVFIWIIWIITIISNLWYDVSALITWAWIWWLAIALAAQKTISNIFGALSVIINKPFKIWDFITIWNYTWTVKDIWLTYLKIISLKWNEILIPNENILSSSIENLDKRENRREDIYIWVTYDTTLEKLKKWIKIIEDLLKSKKENIIDFRVHFASFGDFSLNIEITYFTNIKDIKTHQKLKEQINLEIKKIFEKEKIEMAFPTQTLYINKINN